MKKILLLLLLILAGSAVRSDVKLPAIFSDGAVLQKSEATAVFGEADPQEIVTVTYGKASSSTTTDSSGRWLVRLDLSKCGNEPGQLVVKGKNTVVSNDVITGDVWLCAGQSNMRFTMRNVLNAKEEISKSANDRIRNFIVKNPIPFASGEDGPKPASFAVGVWEKASPKNTGTFSAVGYFFAREINASTGNTIGLVDPSIGASSIEAWLSSEALFKQLSKDVQVESADRLTKYRSYDDLCAKHIKKIQKWESECSRSDKAADTVPDNAKWRKVKQLAKNYPGNGVLWFRKKCIIKQDDVANKSIRFKLEYPNAPATIYVDGKCVGRFSPEEAAAGKEFKLSVPENIAFPGEHELAVRFHISANRLKIFSKITTGKSRINNRDWEMFRELKYPALTLEQKKSHPGNFASKPYPQTLPARIFDRKLHPIFPYTLKGTLWYQGENNADETRFLYSEMQTALINELRKNFCNPDMPFYAVQLTSFRAKSNDPGNTGYWCDVRAQQSKVMNSLKNCHEAVILDLGEADDIHPIAKQEVGRRLAVIALANTYGKKEVNWQFAQAISAERSGAAVTVKFSNTCGKLQAQKLPEFFWLARSSSKKAKLIPNSPESEVEGFSLCGKDGKWHWADARISGDTVIVTSRQVPEPVAVRYAWQDNPTCNLVNKNGLPVHPLFFTLK